MNKEILEIKIAELLNVPSEDKKITFSLFKDKVSSLLKIGEAIRIKDLGIFQIKEKFQHTRSSNLSSSSAKNLTILFTSDSDQSPSDSLFLNLDIDKKIGDDIEFSDDVFQLGIEKSLKTKIDDGEEGESEEITSTNEIEEKISALLADSEKIENFDLWEDHFKIKETKNILDGDENGSDENIIEEEILEEDKDISDELPMSADLAEENNEKDFLKEEFVELNDEEKLESYIDENDFKLDDSVEELDKAAEDVVEKFEELKEDQVEQTHEGEEIISDIIDKAEEPIIEEFDNVIEDKIEDEIEIDEEIDKSETSVDEIETEKSVIDEIEMELKNDEEVEIKDESEKADEFLSGDGSLSPDDDLNEEIDVSEIENEAENDEEIIPVADVIEPNKKNKSFIYALIGAFVIIGALSIYYLFFNNGINQYVDNEERLKSEAHVENEGIDEGETQTSVWSGDDNLSDRALGTDNTAQKSLDDESFSNDEMKNGSYENAEESIAGGTVDGSKDEYTENEVSDNIFYDGYVYNVQVSSWKSREIAEKEVAKLNKRGFPAFIVKAYIQKFQGTWHRVRIGPYTSLDEAKIAQSKI